MHMNRRQALLRTLFGATGIGRVALATGIPIPYLLNPRAAMAAQATATCLDPTKAQRLVLITSGSGDPLNANVPGSYDDPQIAHATVPTMAATDITQNGVKRKGAAAWAALPQALLDQTVFFHNATGNTGHGQEPGALKLGGRIKAQDMLVSALAAELSGCLGAIQKEPVCVGAAGATEMLSAAGRVQPIIQPQALAGVLGSPAGPLTTLQPLRDKALDAMNAWYKANKTAGAANFVDRYATSQAELRAVSGTALNDLATIRDNSVASQILATKVLFLLNVTAATSMHVAFGGDNHGDRNFAGEAVQTVAGVKAISDLYASLATAKLDQSTTMFSINVFGRTLRPGGGGGRDHNPNHHVTVMVGKGLKGGVVGGATAAKGASAIDPATGAASDSGSIAPSDSLVSTGKTLARAVGLTDDWATKSIDGGAVVTAVLA